MKIIENLLPKVKSNLVIEHDDDDELLRNHIRAALDYAKNYQNKKRLTKLIPSTEQAIILLATHFYQSRDGGTAGFFTDYIGAVNNVWNAVHRLLALNKSWEV